MPKVALRPIDKFEQMITANIKTVKGGDTNEKLGAYMHTSIGTARNRVNNPLDMSLKELFLLCEKKHINMGDFVTRLLKIGA